MFVQLGYGDAAGYAALPSALVKPHRLGHIHTDHPSGRLATLRGRHDDTGALTVAVEPPATEDTTEPTGGISDDEITEAALAHISRNPGQGVRQIVRACKDLNLPKTRSGEALQDAKDRGWVKATPEGQRHLHHITEAGTARLEQPVLDG